MLAARPGLVVAALTMWVGCFATRNDAEFSPGDDDVVGDLGCAVDEDCVLAGPSCCECPSFALPESSRWDDACEQVDCPMPAACPALVARCEAGTCMAVCAAVECDLSCPEGFAVDAAGCTVCSCGSGPLVPECAVAADCVRVPGDCCGCDRGGTDVAVPVGQADAFAESLMCGGDEACPGVSTCDPGAMAICSGGRCALGSAGGTAPDDGECGRPDQPPCPDGLVCVINAADAEAGTGRCQPPSP